MQLNSLDPFSRGFRPSWSAGALLQRIIRRSSASMPLDTFSVPRKTHDETSCDDFGVTNGLDKFQECALDDQLEVLLTNLFF